MPTSRTPRAQRSRRDRGEGSIARLPGRNGPGTGRWSVRVTNADGTRQRLRGGPWDSEQEARDALLRWQAQRLDGHSARASLGTTSLKTVYLRSIEPLGGLDASPDRRTFFRGAIERPTPDTARTRKNGDPDNRYAVRVPEGRIFLGSMPVGEVTIEVVEEWAAALRATGLGPATVARWGRHLSQTLGWAAARGYITANPVPAAVLLPRGATAAARQPRYFFTLAEMKAIIDTVWRRHQVPVDPANPDGPTRAGDRVYPTSVALAIDTLLWSGLRQGEMRALTPGSLLREPGAMLAVTASVKDMPGGGATPGRTKTLGSQRRVAIPSGLMTDLGNHVEASVSSGKPLFPAVNGDWWRGDSFTDTWAAVMLEAGIWPDSHSPHLGRRKMPTPHDARATGASLLFACGADVPHVSAWLGHTNPQLTLSLYTEIQGWGEEDPVLQDIRSRRLTVPEILDAVYEAVQAMPPARLPDPALVKERRKTMREGRARTRS